MDYIDYQRESTLDILFAWFGFFETESHCVTIDGLGLAM